VGGLRFETRTCTSVAGRELSLRLVELAVSSVVGSKETDSVSCGVYISLLAAGYTD
jgi:hypothetical protein